ncbi:MAG: CBS domain-containing protein [Rhizobiales bacterium]|nr:CBS domain-containing protein [Hyphomicrobiales bacterium]
MSDVSDAISGDRRKLANRIVWSAILAISFLALVIIIAVAWIVLSGKQPDYRASEAVSVLQGVLASVLPLFGAWVGAVIAFYFAKENFDSAAANTRALLKEVVPTALETIRAREIMIENKDGALERTRTVGEDNASLSSKILPRFEGKGLGRIVILKDDDTGVGVAHDGHVNRFLLAGVKAGTLAKVSDATLRMLLDDPEIQRILANSVVYVGAGATLAEVKDKMEKASKGAKYSCRDAFVTDTGDATGKVIGYVSDIDLAKRGAFG